MKCLEWPSALYLTCYFYLFLCISLNMSWTISYIMMDYFEIFVEMPGSGSSYETWRILRVNSSWLFTFDLRLTVIYYSKN